MAGKWAAITLSVALASCAPRLENRAGEPVTRQYAANSQTLADCTFKRLDWPGSRIRKSEFPSEKRVNLALVVENATDWSADFVAEGPVATRVTIPYPMTFGETHPDHIFRQVDICAGVIPPPNEPKLGPSGNYE